MRDRSVGRVRAFGRLRSLRWVAVMLLLMPQTLWSATIPVSGPCTLIDAINAANNDDDSGGLCPPGGSGADTLTLSGNVTLTAVDHLDGFFGDPTGLPTVSSDVTVEGGGFIIERDGGTPEFRIFFVDGSGTLTLNDVTVRNGGGSGVGDGGGVATLPGGTLILTNTTLSGNIARTLGGGIGNRGTATLTDTTLSGNYGFYGGGIGNRGTATLTNTTLSGNFGILGGGFYNIGTASLTNTTLSGNLAFRGGGIFIYGPATLTNTTLSGNSADEGGGIFNKFNYLTLTNSIVANSPDGDNCRGPFGDGGNNFDDDGTCTGASPIVAGVDFDTTLAANGGPTQTHALLPGSVAQDAAGVCGLITDQRGVLRNDGACDSGAIEWVPGACCTNGPGTDSDCIVAEKDNCESAGGLFLGAGTECTGDLDCTLLLVTMESMSATTTPGGALLSWTTVSEVDTVGFRLLRETPGGREKAMSIVASMIPAHGNGLGGASYEYLDVTFRRGIAAQYYIEDVDIFGKVTRHGPIVPERRAQRGRMTAADR